jgi:hypothetical protein
MIVVKNTGKLSTRLNFVDDKDNFVGWDDTTCCCEDHFWDVFKDAQGNEGTPAGTLADCVFDISIAPHYLEDDSKFVREGGGVMVFTLKHDDGTPRYLMVGNDHNGYYSHSYDYRIGTHSGEGSL